jgi:hypothetical protein
MPRQVSILVDGQAQFRSSAAAPGSTVRAWIGGLPLLLPCTFALTFAAERGFQTRGYQREQGEPADERKKGHPGIRPRLVRLLEHVLHCGDGQETGDKGKGRHLRTLARTPEQKIRQEGRSHAEQNEGRRQHDPALPRNPVLAEFASVAKPSGMSAST